MRILVVEDESKIAQFIKTGLELESWVVDIAQDGEIGLDLAATESYGVIILDIMLPGISGIDVCNRLRNEFKIHTPVLILTAKGATNEKVDLLNAGADDYLVKPFAFAELVARVRALSRRPLQQTGALLQHTDLTIDIIKRKVRRGEKEIALSRLEYGLLEYLVQNAGRVQSKDEIIQHVWSYDDDILPNTVEVYINYLREKIDKKFPELQPLIKTVRGFGYVIE